MEITEDALLGAIERAGLRRTRPRQAVLAQIATRGRDGADFTADSLWRAVQRQSPEIGRSTVFRTIDALARIGLLDRIGFADGTDRYHVAPLGAHHHHLTCDACHQVVNIDVCLPAARLQGVASREGFTLTGHRLELFGVCPRCQRGLPVS